MFNHSMPDSLLQMCSKVAGPLGLELFSQRIRRLKECGIRATPM